MGVGSVLATSGQSCGELGIFLEQMCNLAMNEIHWQNVLLVTCGLEPGWDNAVALTAIDIGIPVHVVLPYGEWALKWDKGQQKRCARIIEAATMLTLMEGHEHTNVYADRHMVSLADQLVTLGRPGWESERQSVATLKGMPVRSLWPAWQEVSE